MYILIYLFIYIGLDEENLLSHLLDQISPQIENETTVIEHSKYYNDVEFKNYYRMPIVRYTC